MSLIVPKTGTQLALGDTPILTRTPQWYLFKTTYQSYSAALPFMSLVLFVLPSGGMIHSVNIKHNTQFSGFTSGPLMLYVGNGLLQTQHHSGADVTNFPPSNTLFTLQSHQTAVSFGATQDIHNTAFNLGSGNLNTMTQGSADIWVLMSQMEY